MIQTFRAIVFASVLVSPPAAGLAAQLPSGSSEAHANPYRASVVDVAAWLGDVGGTRPVIEVDPRILVTGARGLPPLGDALHAPEAFAGVASDKTVIIMPLERARQCTGIGARTCRTDGRFVAVAFGTVAVTGDTATVNAFVRVSRAPTEAELARMRASANPSSALTRFGEEAGSATHFRLTLARRSGLWSVVTRAIIGQT